MKEGYKQTEIGVIPEDWLYSQLNDIADFCNETIPTNTINISNYIGTENMLPNGAGIRPNVLTITSFRVREYKESDILLSNIRPYLKKIWFSTVHGGCSNDVIVIRSKSPRHIINQYLYWFISQDKFFDYVMSSAIGTKMPRGDKSIIKSFFISYPPDHKEQQLIAEALSDVDELIASLEKLIEKKKAIKQGAMQELLTGKRRLPGFSMPWIHVNISDLAEIYSGGTPDTSNSDYWGGNIPWMNSGELNLKIVQQVQGRITQRGYDNSSTHYIPAFCVLIGLAGQGKTRGTAAYNTFPLCTNQSIAAIYPNPKVYDSKFLYYMMDVQYDKLRELSSGDGGRGGLTKNLLLNYSLTIPKDVEEQRAIAAIMTAIDNEIMSLEAKLTKAQQIKQGMMQRLLTGAIRLI